MPKALIGCFVILNNPHCNKNDTMNTGNCSACAFLLLKVHTSSHGVKFCSPSSLDLQ